MDDSTPRHQAATTIWTRVKKLAALAVSGLDPFFPAGDDLLRFLGVGARRDGLCREFPIGEPTEFGWQVLPDNTGWGPFYLAMVRKIR